LDKALNRVEGGDEDFLGRLGNQQPAWSLDEQGKIIRNAGCRNGGTGFVRVKIWCYPAGLHQIPHG
jgi:hypothetical protein